MDGEVLPLRPGRERLLASEETGDLCLGNPVLPRHLTGGQRLNLLILRVRHRDQLAIGAALVHHAANLRHPQLLLEASLGLRLLIGEHRAGEIRHRGDARLTRPLAQFGLLAQEAGLHRRQCPRLLAGQVAHAAATNRGRRQPTTG